MSSIIAGDVLRTALGVTTSIEAMGTAHDRDALTAMVGALEARLVERSAGCPGCRPETVVSLALAVLERHRRPAMADTRDLAVGPLGWGPDIDALLPILVPESVAPGGAELRQINTARQLDRRYRNCVAQLLDALAAEHGYPAVAS